MSLTVKIFLVSESTRKRSAGSQQWRYMSYNRTGWHWQVTIAYFSFFTNVPAKNILFSVILLNCSVTDFQVLYRLPCGAYDEWWLLYYDNELWAYIWFLETSKCLVKKETVYVAESWTTVAVIFYLTVRERTIRARTDTIRYEYSVRWCPSHL